MIGIIIGIASGVGALAGLGAVNRRSRHISRHCVGERLTREEADAMDSAAREWHRRGWMSLRRLRRRMRVTAFGPSLARDIRIRVRRGAEGAARNPRVGGDFYLTLPESRDPAVAQHEAWHVLLWLEGVESGGDRHHDTLRQRGLLTRTTVRSTGEI